MSSEFSAERDAVTTIIEKYKEFKADIRNGKYEKTTEFWVVYYTDVLSMQCKLMILACGGTD